MKTTLARGTDGTPSRGEAVKDVAVIGGGAAGMTAAIFAARAGASVTLYEKNGTGRLGRKLGITGKGRCNLTNECGIDDFLQNIASNPRFLYSAFASFPPREVMSWFESLGVPLKTERGRRVFPVSDKATDVVFALTRELKRSGAGLRGSAVLSVEPCAEGFRIITGAGESLFRSVIIATGGKSYSVTGSDGSGYRLAGSLGHTLTPPVPALVPLVAGGGICARLQGLTLKNIAFTVRRISDGRAVYEDFGELLFAHFGLTGPVVLSASSVINREIAPGVFRAEIDLKPALEPAVLDARLLSDFSSSLNRNFSNSISALLPSKLIPVFVERTGIAPDRKVNSITKAEREKILGLLKCFDLGIDALRPIDEAIVTSGGISVKELDPKTMGSKLCEGLYFAGEIIDVDALTGGYNLQIAWSTGRLAGLSAAGYVSNLN
jgi:flavoprotein, HI0933 family